MKRMTRILKKDNFIPEMGYLIITSEGMSVYNGKMGIHYSRKIAGERLAIHADKNGPFAVPEPMKFLNIVRALENISSVELDKSSKSLVIRFGKKGITHVPVVTDLSPQIPHLQLQWIKDGETLEEPVEVTSLWDDIRELTTNEGEALWGDVIGVYGDGNQLISFDYGIYLHSEDVKCSEFFCPRSLLELGTRHMNHCIKRGEQLFIIGPDVQYVFTGIKMSPVVKDMIKLKDDFIKGDRKKVTLDFTSGVWKRSKIFAPLAMSMKIKNGEIFLGNETWSESIGKTEAPDSEFMIRGSLIERWAGKTFDHSISIAEDGTWYLYGKTRAGLSLYASLTDTASTIPQRKNNEKEVSNIGEEKSSEEDIEEGATLI